MRAILEACAIPAIHSGRLNYCTVIRGGFSWQANVRRGERGAARAQRSSGARSPIAGWSGALALKPRAPARTLAVSAPPCARGTSARAYVKPPASEAPVTRGPAWRLWKGRCMPRGLHGVAVAAPRPAVAASLKAAENHDIGDVRIVEIHHITPWM
eukprot:13523424-Alexandrium_andersonii.AAC.1